MTIMTTKEIKEKRRKLHELKMLVYSASIKVSTCTKHPKAFTSKEIADVKANYESLLKEHDTLLEELKIEGKADCFDALLLY